MVVRRFLLLLSLVLAVAVATAGPAAAHAELTGTDPPAGAQLERSPEEVVLTFTEPVEAQTGALQVYDGDGERVDDGDVRRDGSTVRLPVDLDDGGYVVTYRVVSVDGHPISGGFTFRVGEEAEEVDTTLVEELLAGRGSDAGVGAAAAVTRFLAFAAIVLLVGGAFTVAILWPAGAADGRARRLLLGALAVLAVATVAGIGLQAADVAGLGLGDAVRPSVVGDELGRRYGLLSLARLLLLVPAGFLLAALFRGAGRAAWWRASGAAIAVGIVAVTALNGHAAGGRWQAAALVADVVHQLAGAAWLGGLALLVVAVLRREDDVPSVVPAFSRVAFTAVVVLVVTGSFQGYRQVGSIDGLDTTYGRLLLAKVLAVAGLVAVAALTRQIVRHRLVEEGGVGELRRSVGIEAVLAVVVLAVTALLVDATPGTASVLEPVSVTKVVDGVVIDVEVVPARVGPNDVHIYVQDPEAGLTGELEAEAVLSLPAEGFEDVAVPLVRAGRGHWSAYDLDIPIAGDWVLDVRVVRSDSFVDAQLPVEVR